MGFRSPPRTFTWSVAGPAVGGIPGPKLPEAIAVKKLYAYCVGGTNCVFNIENRSAIGSGGTNLYTSEVTAPTSGVAAGAPNNPSVASGNWLWLDISGINGTPTYLVVTIFY
jgi:hypothetical protein